MTEPSEEKSCALMERAAMQQTAQQIATLQDDSGKGLPGNADILASAAALQRKIKHFLVH